MLFWVNALTSHRLLTDWVDVKEAHMCSEYGVEHAVVEGLCAPHQHVKQDHIPDKAEDDGGCCQTFQNKRQKVLLSALKYHREDSKMFE